MQTASETVPKLQPARLLVKRMDCADCAYKASRTLNQLPSVRINHLDYFQGIVDIQHDAGADLASRISIVSMLKSLRIDRSDPK